MRHPGLLNDIMFKIVFGTEQGLPILRALLNALLDLTGEQKIGELELLAPFHEKEYLVEKNPILDVKARDLTGKQYNIEVQLRAGLDDYIKRSLYYVTRLFCDQIQAGQSYDLLAKTVSISILDFNLFPERPELQSRFSLWEQRQKFELTDILELHYIELRKFTLDRPSRLRTRFEKWLFILKFADLYSCETEALPEELKEEEGIPMAIDSMRKAYAKDEIRHLIEAREKAERDERSRLHYAEKKGLEQGLERGLEQGRREMVQRMLTSGLSFEEIARLTGLTLQEVERLTAETRTAPHPAHPAADEPEAPPDPGPGARPS